MRKHGEGRGDAGNALARILEEECGCWEAQEAAKKWARAVAELAVVMSVAVMQRGSSETRRRSLPIMVWFGS
jgi:hypothetical protein